MKEFTDDDARSIFRITRTPGSMTGQIIQIHSTIPDENWDFEADERRFGENVQKHLNALQDITLKEN